MISYNTKNNIINTNKSIENKDKIFKLTSWVECPRWAKIPTLLKQLAIVLNLDIEIDEYKGIIKETVFFTIKGTEDKIIEFDKILKESIEKYNEL